VAEVVMGDTSCPYTIVPKGGVGYRGAAAYRVFQLEVAVVMKKRNSQTTMISADIVNGVERAHISTW
jgi:hypothetical protein